MMRVYHLLFEVLPKDASVVPGMSVTILKNEIAIIEIIKQKM